jgi:hypothetical protein
LPTIIAGGPLSFCQGLTVALISSAASSNQWYKDGVIINGATNQTLIVSASGNYTVSVTTGCSGTSLPTTVTVSAQASAPVITPGGLATFCQGANVILSSSATAGNQWYKDGVTINGATNQTYSATTSGNYTAKVINGGCASTASNIVSVIVIVIPSTPVITQNGNVLTSSAASGNQWYLNGNAIAGATQKTFTAQTSGIYTVNVTVNGCTSSISAGLNVVVTAINSPDLNKKITIFPLPTRDYLFIKYSATGGSFTVNLFDASGKKLFANGKFTSTYQLDLRSYSSGIYIVQIINTRNGEQMRRLVVKL